MSFPWETGCWEKISRHFFRKWAARKKYHAISLVNGLLGKNIVSFPEEIECFENKY